MAIDCPAIRADLNAFAERAPAPLDKKFKHLFVGEVVDVFQGKIPGFFREEEVLGHRYTAANGHARALMARACGE